MDNKNIVIGLDPGLSGGITIINDKKVEVIKMPILKVKDKNQYDIDKLVDFFDKYKNLNIVVSLERQSPRPMEGSVSSHTNGKNYGILLGILKAFKYNVQITNPNSWKGKYIELETQTIVDLRIKSKTLKEEMKLLNKVTQKKIIKEKKKELDKIFRTIKSEAKTAARSLAAKLVPELKDEFIKVNSDGKAESVLIAFYIKEKMEKNELV